MYNPVTGMVMVENNTFKTVRNLMLEIKTYDMSGKSSLMTQVFVEVQPSSVKNFIPIKGAIEKLQKEKGVFLSLRLLDTDKQIVSDNFYWLPNQEGKYEGLSEMKQAKPMVTAKEVTAGKITVSISNPADGPVSFFNRISLVNAGTGKRILPVFYSDNYLSVLPGETKSVELSFAEQNKDNRFITVQSWNGEEQHIAIK